MPYPEFAPFQKIPRLSREMVVTEKIDGTNASIYIGEDGTFLAGSRTRWLLPGQSDNFGFRAWAESHKDELMTLGPGHHFGEWWGSGIQRGYGLLNGEKRFSLFNVSRWCLAGETPGVASKSWEKGKTGVEVIRYQDILPPCVGLVPTLYRGPFNLVEVDGILQNLEMLGSRAAPGFMRPEGVVVFHIAGGVLFKKTIENDMGKGDA